MVAGQLLMDFCNLRIGCALREPALRGSSRPMVFLVCKTHGRSMLSSAMTRRLRKPLQILENAFDRLE